MTVGTPSSSTFAVMHISAMPPGDVASISVAGFSPVARASSHAKAPDTTIITSVPTATAPSQRGAA